MNARGFVTISMHELERVKIIEAVVEHRLKVFQAAERLQLCERQVNRLVHRYQASGPAGLVSGKRGRPGNHQLSSSVAKPIATQKPGTTLALPSNCIGVSAPVLCDCRRPRLTTDISRRRTAPSDCQ